MAWETMQFPNVTADAVANVYFEGRVISHSIHFEDGSRKTLGVIFPGEYHFGTEAAEIMEITDGACSVIIDDTEGSTSYASGESFNIEANSGFTITVEDEGLCQYVCSFLQD